MSKTSLVSILALVFVTLVGFVGQDQPSAEQVLRESKDKFESLEDFSSSFLYALTNPSQKTANQLEKNGTIKYSKGKYVIDMEDQSIYCDLETMWIHIKSDEEVIMTNYDPEEQVIDFGSIFTLYETNAKARYEPSEDEETYKIFISSTSKNVEYNQVYVWINKKTKMLTKAVTINRLQIRTTYEFSNIKTNVGLTAKDFQFDKSKHPDVTVIDEKY